MHIYIYIYVHGGLAMLYDDARCVAEILATILEARTEPNSQQIRNVVVLNIEAIWKSTAARVCLVALRLSCLVCGNQRTHAVPSLHAGLLTSGRSVPVTDKGLKRTGIEWLGFAFPSTA